jgi:hypothetical protein
MGTNRVIILQVGGHEPAEMSFVEDKHMLEELAPEAADHALRVGILPRAPRGSQHFLNAHVPHPLVEIRPVDIVPVAQ